MTAHHNSSRILTLLASAMIAGFVGDAALSAPPALAQAGVTNANLTDPDQALERDNAPVATLTDNRPARFSQTTPAPDDPQAEPPRQFELEIQAPSSITGNFDVSLAQRASIGADRTGDLNRRGRGSEVRVGRSLGDPTSPGTTRGSDAARVYMFAGADDEAITWQPGGEGRGVALQDRVEVGDHQAGITYERNGVQASLAYVDRKISTTVGQTTASDRESFAGVTLTMRR